MKSPECLFSLQILSKLRLSGVLTTSISSHSASENEDQTDERAYSDVLIDSSDGTDFVGRVCGELNELARLIALDPPSQWTDFLSENMVIKYIFVQTKIPIALTRLYLPSSRETVAPVLTIDALFI